ncbi:hypothetical protein EYF80_050748 [Liparis tanakae]|uniref:Uncharacterized protein n=1 Tax=Liparis tanakae TaxID=230148 RepID=A0A4Z2FD67_9TELE|nr:hypothetical protein EYF80_050748 [Liparis tanakae]
MSASDPVTPCVGVRARLEEVTRQGSLQLQPSVGAQKDVEEGIQQGVEAGQAVAQAVDQENGTLHSTRLVGQQQGHESVTAHEVVGSEHDNEVDGDHDENAHDFAALVVGEGRGSPECHPDVGRGVAEGGSRVADENTASE